jgi:hypothetical protein
MTSQRTKGHRRLPSSDLACSRPLGGVRAGNSELGMLAIAVAALLGTAGATACSREQAKASPEPAAATATTPLAAGTLAITTAALTASNATSAQVTASAAPTTTGTSTASAANVATAAASCSVKLAAQTPNPYPMPLAGGPRPAHMGLQEAAVTKPAIKPVAMPRSVGTSQRVEQTPPAPKR